jgi:hypothetical protein
LNRDQAEIVHGGRRYVVPVSEIDGRPGVLRFPDGALVDKRRLMLVDEYGEKFTVRGKVPAFGGPDVGSLPYLSVVDVVAEITD